MNALPAAAEVVVVGGGVIGTSIAFHLAEAGVDVCLLERDQLAGGSTSRAAGGIRAQFSDPLNIAIGLRSIEAFSRFGERPGAEIDLRQVGYLFLLDRPEDVVAFESSVALQNELGVPSRFVDLAEARALCPLAGLEGVLAATYCPLDGHASPEAVVQGYAAGAREHGASILTGCEVTAVLHGGDEIRGVETALGTVETATVVCAAGVWSPADRPHGRNRAPGRAVPPRSRVHRPDARSPGPLPSHDRLLDRLLLPPRGARTPVRDGRPRSSLSASTRPPIPHGSRR